MKQAADATTEVRDFIGRLPVFADLSDSSLSALARNGRLLHNKKGQFIFLQSDPAERFYILRTGQVSILLESSDGREMVINELRAGDCFGELGLLTGQTRSTSALAHTDVELLVFSRQTFLTIIESEPLFSRRILDITANRLRHSSERESALAFLDAQARLARILLQLNEQEEEKGYVTISQEELAQRTGLTRQTVAKTLGYWRKAGWLITGRGHIMLLREEEFAKLEKEWLMN